MPDKLSILFPMVALATLTFSVLLLIPLRRFRAGRASLIAYATALALAWTYVGLRLVHSAIHVTYNRVRHRLVAFGASNVALIMLWTNLLRALSA